MKNSEVFSAVVGSTFFAVPYLALAVPILPSLAIGAAAFAAGELVFRKTDIIPVTKTLTFKEILEDAKVKNEHILSVSKLIEDKEIQDNVKEINETVDKIIKTLEKNPEKKKYIKNFFDYYLPVTEKIVMRYDEIENQKIVSDESDKFFKSTNDTIKEINKVCKKMLNNLYQSEMIDTNAEVKVLNTMLKADGLNDNDIVISKEVEDE